MSDYITLSEINRICNLFDSFNFFFFQFEYPLQKVDIFKKKFALFNILDFKIISRRRRGPDTPH